MKKIYSFLLLTLFAVNGVFSQSSITGDGKSIVIDLDATTPLTTQYNPDADKYNFIYGVITDILIDAGFTDELATWNAVTSVKLTGEGLYSWMDLRAVRNRFLNVETLDLSEMKLLDNKIQGQLTWSGGKYVETGYPATNTGAFAQLTKLTTVSLPGDMTIIGKCAFANCTKLTNLDLPASLKTIETEAFRSCINLTIPNGLPAAMDGFINNDAFFDCSNLVLTGAFPANLRITSFTQIFRNCTKVAFTSLNSVALNDGSKMLLGNNLFNNSGIAITEIPDGIYGIGQNAFYNCKDITEITFPLTLGTNKPGWAPNFQEAVSYIGSKAFGLAEGSTVNRKYIFLAETPPQGKGATLGVSPDAFSIGTNVDVTSVVLVPNATAVTNFIAIDPFDKMNVRAQINTIDINAGANGTVSTSYGTIADNKVDADYGDAITFDITPAQGYIVDEATLDGANIVVNNNKITFTVEGAAARTPGHALAVTFKLDSPTSIDESDADAISIYPNPTADVVTVKGFLDGALKQVYDATGRLVLQTKENSFNLSEQAQGIYFIKVESQIIKVVKK
ncbi:MAG: leucine-rich repeat protein [Dysgonomonas sp.]